MTILRKLNLPSGQAVLKRLYQSLPFGRSGRHDLLLIFGCQRSGTTMFADAFRADFESEVFGEKGLNEDGEMRLPELGVARARIDASKAGLRVAKPLVESQRAAGIMEYFPDARAVWMFRNYADVARSAAKRFSSEAPYRNLQPIVDSSLPTDFASETVSPQTREFVRRHFSREMSGDAAQALYWYVRNVRYFEQGLDRHDRVLLCSYENFVQEPVKNMARVYAFLGRPFPGARIVAHIAPRPRREPSKRLALPEDLAELCDGLLAKLERTELEGAASLRGETAVRD